MTREDIKKKSMDYFDFTGKSNDIDSLVRGLLCKAFVEGAQWRINSVWHDRAEKADTSKELILMYSNGSVRVTLFVSDILPERKEETK